MVTGSSNLYISWALLMVLDVGKSVAPNSCELVLGFLFLFQGVCSLIVFQINIVTFGRNSQLAQVIFWKGSVRK